MAEPNKCSSWQRSSAAEQGTHKPLVAGSNPAATTKVAALSAEFEVIHLREILEMLLGEDGKRRLRFRQMTNEDLFASYDSELVLRISRGRAYMKPGGC